MPARSPVVYTRSLSPFTRWKWLDLFCICTCYHHFQPRCPCCFCARHFPRQWPNQNGAGATLCHCRPPLHHQWCLCVVTKKEDNRSYKGKFAAPHHTCFPMLRFPDTLPAKLNQFEYLVEKKNIADFDLFLLVCQLSLLLWSGLLDDSLAAMFSHFSVKALQCFKNIRKCWIRYRTLTMALSKKAAKILSKSILQTWTFPAELGPVSSGKKKRETRKNLRNISARKDYSAISWKIY